MSKNKLFNPKKNTPKNRKELVEEWSDFYHLELWDRSFVENLLELPIDDSDLEVLLSGINAHAENAYYEGYDEVRDKLTKLLLSDDIEDTGHYDTRASVLALDFQD